MCVSELQAVNVPKQKKKTNHAECKYNLLTNSVELVDPDRTGFWWDRRHTIAHANMEKSQIHAFGSTGASAEHVYFGATEWFAFSSFICALLSILFILGRGRCCWFAFVWHTCTTHWMMPCRGQSVRPVGKVSHQSAVPITIGCRKHAFWSRRSFRRIAERNLCYRNVTEASFDFDKVSRAQNLCELLHEEQTELKRVWRKCLFGEGRRLEPVLDLALFIDRDRVDRKCITLSVD